MHIPLPSWLGCPRWRSLGLCRLSIFLLLAAAMAGIAVSKRAFASHPSCQCVTCAPTGRMWASGEFLLWWTDAQTAPPLVTRSPVGTAPAVAGVLNQPGTQVLFGGDLDKGVHPGGRVTVGWWNEACSQGLQVTYLGLGRRVAEFSATQADFPILARPVVDALANAEGAMLVAHPNFLNGSVSADASTELHAAEVLWRSTAMTDCDGTLDVLLGYSFKRLGEALDIEQRSVWTAAQGPISPGTILELSDRFHTRNHFHGAQLGLVYETMICNWSLELLGKVAIGSSRSRVQIDGATRTTVPGVGAADFGGGLLAQPTNMGQFEQNRFAAIPELGVTMIRQLDCGLRFRIGYSLLYWNEVARPADQIDRAVSQFPPEPIVGPRPQFTFTSGSFWAQGMHLGLDYCY